MSETTNIMAKAQQTCHDCERRRLCNSCEHQDVIILNAKPLTIDDYFRLSKTEPIAGREAER